MTIPPAKEPPDPRSVILAQALRSQRIAVLHQATDRRFDLVEGSFDGWTTGKILGLAEPAAFPPTIADIFVNAYDRCSSERQPVTFEFDWTHANHRAFFRAEMQQDQAGILTIVTDITEARASEQAVASLLREVSHRSKNLLAIVQAVAMQTAVHSGGVQDFLDKFRGRLHALSGTQDLVTESNWRGTQLKALIGAQMTRVSKPALVRFEVTGENPTLGPNASLHVGLAIHELASNAVGHGAFAAGRNGQVQIDASYQNNSAGLPDLILRWRETGKSLAPGIVSPRFGTLVLERIVPLSVGGTAEYSLGPDEVIYTLKIPADQFEA